MQVDWDRDKNNDDRQYYKRYDYILGKIQPSDSEVVEKSNEHGKNKYTDYRKKCA
jgi:hypothetical protein